MFGSKSIFFEGSSDPMWVVKQDDFTIIKVNDAAVAAYGYDRDELLGMAFLDLYSPIEAPRLLQSISSLGRHLHDLGYWRLRCKDAQDRDVEIRVQPISEGDCPTYMIATRGFSHVLALEACRKNLSLNAAHNRRAIEREGAGIKALFEARPGKFLILDPKTYKVTAICSDFARNMSIDRDTVIGQSLFDMIPEASADFDTDHSASMRASIDRVIKTGRTDLLSVEPYQFDGGADGGTANEERFQSTVTTPIKDNAGRVVLIVHRTDDVTSVVNEMSSGPAAAAMADFSGGQAAMVAFDIAQLAKVHLEDAKKARHGEFMLKEAQRIGHMGSWEMDAATGAMAWSDQIYAILGVDVPEQPMTLETFFEYVHPEDRNRLLKAKKRAVELNVPINMAHRIIRPDGEVRRVRHIGEKHPQPDGPTLFGTMQDVTLLHRANAETNAGLNMLRIAGQVSRLGAWRFVIGEETCKLTEVTADILGLGPKLSIDAWQLHAMYAPEYSEFMKTTYAACVKDGTPFDVEVVIISTKGERIWLRDIGEAERDPQDKIIALRGAFQDITEIVLARERNSQGTRMLGFAGRVARLGGWSVDLSDMKVSWNGEIANIHGTSTEYVPDFDGGIEHFAPEDQAAARLAFENCAEKGISFNDVRQIINATGERVWVRSIGEPGRDGDGRIVAVHGAMQDINDLVLAQKSAERVSQQLLDTFESIRDAIMTVDRDWRFVLVNSECARLLEFSEAEMIGKVMWDLFPDAVGTAFWDNYHLAMSAGKTIRFTQWYPPLSKWFNVSVFPSAEGLSIYFYDTSASREQEMQLHLLETAVARMNDVIIITDAATKEKALESPIVFVNDAFSKLTGYSRSEAMGKTPRILQGSDTQKDQLARIRSAISSERVVKAELINYTKAGKEFWTELDITPIIDDAGSLTHYVSIQRDITDRRAAEAESRLNLERFRLAAEATTDVIWDWDICNGTSWWSGGMEQVYLRPRGPDSRERTVWLEAMHPDDHERVVAGLMRVVNSEGSRWQDEYRFIRGDGTIAAVMDRGFVIRKADGTASRMIGCMTDLTRQRDLEARLRQSQRLEAVGQLTGGIAHDFNNLLTVILGNSEVLSESLASAPDLRRLADMTVIAAERGGELTRRLLAFARKQSLDPKSLDVNGLISRMESLLHRTLPANIDLKFDLSADAWTILVDPGQLENALLNLVINSRDAMPDGGRLLITTRNVAADACPDMLVNGTASGEFVKVSVTDNGAGMPPDVAERAFDPFFTTKGLEKGSGLGLSMVYGFARQSGGRAILNSVLGNGTTVTLYLPRANAVAETIKLSPSFVLPAQGTAHILLVEDDAMVMEYASLQLASLGYRVTTAMDGDAALELLTTLDDVDLLFSDVIMPGRLNGYDLAVEAQKQKPKLKILLTSGYNQNVMSDVAAELSNTSVLNKPYRRGELAVRIKAALERI